MIHDDPETRRLEEDERREKNWKRWGPYLAERQWGTVREDYSDNGNPWDYLPHDHARSRAYRWGEDGLLGICDRQGRLCLAFALWNGRDPILKERLFGLTGPEGNHGEDVKECYFYLDSTPTHSYMRALYKYPQAEFPYEELMAGNRSRGREDPEFELTDTGVFDGGRYFDVEAEYAKAGPDDVLVRLHVANRGPEAATLHVLPTLWFRNTWSWGRSGEGYWPEPLLAADGAAIEANHQSLGRFRFECDGAPDAPALLFTGNETNTRRLFGAEGPAYAKDAFHAAVIGNDPGATNPKRRGTKAAAWYRLEIGAGESTTLRMSLRKTPGNRETFDGSFDDVFEARRREADAFYASRIPTTLGREASAVARQAFAGLLWSRQFYHYVVDHWLQGDPSQPTPPAGRLTGRNAGWEPLYNRDVISMPDKWEYPWYAAWDLAFHMIPFTFIDPGFAKSQLVLFLREWYMHPNGQIPAYEFAFGDVNPPVHAWACWRVYKKTGGRGKRDLVFLSRVFQKLLMNFTWWVNRKDVDGRHLFAGGFLGLDNIGVFDRSRPLPMKGHLEQADGTAWMAFYCTTMLSMALELARDNPASEDMASKFFEHFVVITDAMNLRDGSGLWDEQDGFYYDRLNVEGRRIPLRVRSMVGLVPLFACGLLEQDVIDRLPGFRKRLAWFLENKPDLARHVLAHTNNAGPDHSHRLLAVPPRDRLERVLRYVVDEDEFLSAYGVRSLSKYHDKNPYVFHDNGNEYRVAYDPGESTTGLFGGNSNWRGPVWFPVNYLLVEALELYHHFYGDDFQIECPARSGRFTNLAGVADEISARLARLFIPDADGRRPYQSAGDPRAADPAWRDHVLFHEYFDAETGRGLGASHQTGWTALVVEFLEHHRPPGDPVG